MVKSSKKKQKNASELSRNRIPKTNSLRFRLVNKKLEQKSNTNLNTIKVSVLTGRWSQDEHVKFLKGCIKFDNSWGKVRYYVINNPLC